MKRTTTAGPAPDALDHLIAACWSAGRLIVRDLLLPLLALAITLATLHREPALPKLQTTAPAPLALPPASGPLDALPVRELRQLARAAGHRALARNGRKAELLAALEA
jgi:hypothetical protein